MLSKWHNHVHYGASEYPNETIAIPLKSLHYKTRLKKLTMFKTCSGGKVTSVHTLYSIYVLIINLNLIRTYSLTNTTQHDFPSNIFLWMLLCETYPYWSADKNRMHEARVKRFVGFFLEAEALFFLLTCCIFRYSYKTKYSGGHENFVKMNKNSGGGCQI